MTKKNTKSMSSEDPKTIRFQVFGRVQGVGFRWWTKSRATGLGLRGTVRNLEDGTVEVIATGTSAALEALGHHLQSGPPSAAVARVISSPADGSATDVFKIM